jgi:DNA-3-methyladenine glycosylase
LFSPGLQSLEDRLVDRCSECYTKKNQHQFIARFLMSMTADISRPEPLPQSFFERDTRIVARELLGCRLVRRSQTDGRQLKWTTWTIVETEAYMADDPACHAYQRRQGRAAMLYAQPGTAYVYLTYGMYHCVNVVTEPLDIAGAVLFRGLAPTHDLSLKPKDVPADCRTNGPGRLARALQITRDACNGYSLTDKDNPAGFYLATGEMISSERIVETTRIGITRAVDFPWRYYILGNPWVSVRNKSAEALLS